MRPEPVPVAKNVPGLLYLEQTTGGGEATARLPWLLAFHGLGDRPESFSRLFGGLTTPSHLYVVQAPMPYGKGFDWFAVRASGNPEALSVAMRKATHQVSQLLEKLRKDPKNLGKPVITGFSQGGMLSFALAISHSQKLAASLPIGGMLPQPLWPDQLPPHPAPLFVFHGAEDSVVPWEPTRKAIAHLKALGFAVTARSYPGLGHSLHAPLKRQWRATLSQLLQKEAISSLSSLTAAHPSKQPEPKPGLAR